MLLNAGIITWHCWLLLLATATAAPENKAAARQPARREIHYIYAHTTHTRDCAVNRIRVCDLACFFLSIHTIILFFFPFQMMCRLYIIVVSIERCAHGRPTWKYTEKGAYNKSLANLILSCIYASHCYQHQFSSSPFYNNAASCAAALLLIKAAFSARSPIARLTPAKYI